MHRKDILSSLFWILCGTLIIVGSLHLPVGEPQNPGPGFLPLLVGVLMTILSITLLAFSLRSSPPEEKIKWGPKGNLYKMVNTLLAMSIYVVAFPPFGFLLTTTVLLIFLFRAIGGLSWKISLVGGTCISGMVYLLFKVWLQVQFPAGLLGV